MREDAFGIAYRLLDSELIDSNGRRCGRVDDVEIAGEPGAPAEVVAILSGPGAFSARVPRLLRSASSRLFGDQVVRVPWDAVDDIAEVLRLKRTGDELGLGLGDTRAARIVAKLPGSDE